MTRHENCGRRTSSHSTIFSVQMKLILAVSVRVNLICGFFGLWNNFSLKGDITSLSLPLNVGDLVSGEILIEVYTHAVTVAFVIVLI